MYKILFCDENEDLDAENVDESDEDQEDFVENYSEKFRESDCSDSNDNIYLKGDNIYIGKDNATKWAKSAGRKNGQG